ncbi:MAG: hypothetical protein EOP23_06905 [Hyphomicrobiales bacterium]|nr:MAG: hypothetical protein EOP23_06905 [Hyphomicrobiales bacterium]
MRQILRAVWAMRGSLIAFAVAIAAAFLTLGYSSLILYAVASPLLTLRYPPMEQWHGPWVWPVLVGVTVAWAPSFMVAGALGLLLKRRGITPGWRRLCYLAVLWVGAILAWFVILGVNFPPGGSG